MAACSSFMTKPQTSNVKNKTWSMSMFFIVEKRKAELEEVKVKARETR